MSQSGIFIAFEGIDGSGKTTQVARLSERLTALGESVVSSKEPTDGRWGRLLRESATRGRLPLDQELGAFVADRKEHLEEKVRPALSEGRIVVLDRYFYSTIAYQGSRGANVGQLTSEMLSFAVVPDIVFLLDLDPFVSLSRISGSRGDKPNEFERIDSLSEVRRIFLALAATRPEVVVLDANHDIDAVYQMVVKRLVDGPLKAKRCAKDYGCDVFHCGPAMAGTCDWFKLQSGLRSVGARR